MTVAIAFHLLQPLYLRLVLSTQAVRISLVRGDSEENVLSHKLRDIADYHPALQLHFRRRDYVRRGRGHGGKATAHQVVHRKDYPLSRL